MGFTNLFNFFNFMMGVTGIVKAISVVGDTINGIIDRTWPNPTKIEKAKIERLRTEIKRELDIVKTQTDINMQEAKSSSIFVAGWRPFVGWVCGFSLLYVSILEPFLRFVASVAYQYSGVFPVIDTNLTMQILIGMLGLAGIRGYEKSKKVARDKLN